LNQSLWPSGSLFDVSGSSNSDVLVINVSTCMCNMIVSVAILYSLRLNLRSF
jgi:hypothetical protein